MRSLFGWPVVVALLAAPFLAPAQAQSNNEARLRDALRETAARLRTAEAALAEQQLATAAAQRERDALKARPAPAAENGREAALRGQVAQLGGALAQARAEEQKWREAEQRASELARRQQSERAVLDDQLAKARAQSAQCAANTQAMYETGREIAALYRDPAFVEFVRGHGRELIGRDRVRNENRVRALEDRLAATYAQAQACRGAAVAQGSQP
ncbi:hypothetical protein [Luteimonas aquatica]|uniref:hypothetical protein n=1 Tax=Luteimonas aquatica TaxID=450364 RepID=UPI001F582EC2|nr:hypothetical protein [Luteimonas aquatica]